MLFKPNTPFSPFQTNLSVYVMCEEKTLTIIINELVVKREPKLFNGKGSVHDLSKFFIKKIMQE